MQHTIVENLVSVIIPVKNRIALLSATIESVYEQSYRPLEIILIDDNSGVKEKEELKKIVDKYHNVDDKIILKMFLSNGNGAPMARNFGFKKSTGSFIQFLDSDDLLLKNKIISQVEILQQNLSLDLTYSKAQFVNEQLERKNEFWGKKLEGNYLDYFLFSWQTMCPIYRRESINKFGIWDEELLINQDWEFSIRYIIKGAKVYFIDEVQSLFRQHEQGNIGNKDLSMEKVNGKFKSTNKIYFLLKENKLLNAPLKKLFFKRWMYVMLITSSRNERNALKEQFLLIGNELSVVQKILLLSLRSAWVSKMILKNYGPNK